MKLDVAPGRPVYVVAGKDDVLLEDAVVELVHLLVGDEDRSLVVEELTHERFTDEAGDHHIGPVVDAARTPPFLTAQRVVVVRHAGAFAAKAAHAPLIDYLADPLPTTRLVLVWERIPKPGHTLPRFPKSLADALEAAGGEMVAADPPRKTGQWVADQLKGSALRFDAGAVSLITDTVGEDVHRLVGLLPTLESVYGAGARLAAHDVAPYLGDEGGVKPWELTDAIDRGDVGLALDRLHRMMGPAGMAGLQVMATLTRHYGQMVALDGMELADQAAAEEVLGLRGYPAKKVLETGRRLGHDRLVAFLGLLAQADLDLRGAKQYPTDVRDGLVLEILVARLASRSGGRRQGASRRSA